MRALLLNGSSHGDSTITTLQEIVAAGLNGNGWLIDQWFLHDAQIAPCKGCFGCWVSTPGLCCTDDDARRIAASLAGSDLLVLLTPVTFGGYSSQLKKAIDRLIPNVTPWMHKRDGETHHEPRYTKHPWLLAVGTQPIPDTEAELIFHTLVARNAINLKAPVFAAAVVAEGSPQIALEMRVHDLLEDVGFFRDAIGAERRDASAPPLGGVG